MVVFPHFLWIGTTPYDTIRVVYRLSIFRVWSLHPFESVDTLDFRLLAFKTVLLIAVTSVIALGEWHTCVITSQFSGIFFSGRMCILYPRVFGTEFSQLYTSFCVETRHIEGIMRALCVYCTLSA